MNRLFQIAAGCLIVCLTAVPVLAQNQTAPNPETAQAPETAAAAETPASGLSVMGTAFGAGMIILGAGYGIAKIGSSSVESMARQPEVAGNVQTAMIISAALIEGATFFALIVCMMAG